MKVGSVLILFVVIHLTACNKQSGLNGNLSSTQSSSAKEGCDAIDPANFVEHVSNQYFPLVPGTVFQYLNTVVEDGQTTTTNVEVTILDETKIIEGVHCQAVHDVVTEDGGTTEDTYDWYAQDKSGTVWYFGEHTKSLKDKSGWTTEGSWKAGSRNACPGVIMWSDPLAHAGETYYQEFLPDIAIDQAEVINTNSTVTVPYGTFTNCLKTREFTILEPDVIEYKYYAAGIGLIKTEMVAGGNEVEVLTAISH